VDSTPPPTTPPNEPAPYVFAAAEYRPTERDMELCRKASHTDWLYIAGTVAMDSGLVVADTQFFRVQGQEGIRLIGPSVVGLAWGWTMGGAYLSLPKCDPNWVSSAPPEGNVKSVTPIMLGIGLFSMATAPFFARIEQGAILQEWPVWERALTVIFPMITGFAGTFIPLLIKPRTYSAALDLERLRLGVTKDAMTLGYGFSF
jgi:hypothetical protein